MARDGSKLPTLGCLVLAAVGIGCGAPEPMPQRALPPVHQATGEALGTTWTVKWLGGDADEDEVSSAIVDALRDVDAAMSTWRDDSELSRVRAADGPVVVSEATHQVVAQAIEVAHATGGAFDPTVQPLVELWGFHGGTRDSLPTDQELAAARAQVGWQRVMLGRDPGGLPTVDSGGTALDLSAIAKGYAVDRVSWALSELGLADHLVEVGGEVRAHGPGTMGQGWRLGVDRPQEGLVPGERLEAVVRLTNMALATSGDYRNVREIDGQRVAHTLDPRTGRPVAGQVASATVVAPDCATADAWATAMVVLGEEEGMRRIEARPQIEALLLVIDGDGFRPVRSSGMDALLLDPARVPMPTPVPPEPQGDPDDEDELGGPRPTLVP